MGSKLGEWGKRNTWVVALFILLVVVFFSRKRQEQGETWLPSPGPQLPGLPPLGALPGFPRELPGMDRELPGMDRELPPLTREELPAITRETPILSVERVPLAGLIPTPEPVFTLPDPPPSALAGVREYQALRARGELDYYAIGHAAYEQVIARLHEQWQPGIPGRLVDAHGRILTAAHGWQTIPEVEARQHQRFERYRIAGDVAAMERVRMETELATGRVTGW